MKPTAMNSSSSTRRRSSYQQSSLKKGQPHPTHSPTSCTSGLLQILKMELPVAPDLPIAHRLRKDTDTSSSSFDSYEHGLAESSYTTTTTTATTTMHSESKISSSSYYIPGITEKARSCLQKTYHHPPPPSARSLYAPELPHQLIHHQHGNHRHHHSHHHHHHPSSAANGVRSSTEPTASSLLLLEARPIRHFEIITQNDDTFEDDNISTLSQNSFLAATTANTTTTSTTSTMERNWTERRSTKALLQSQLGCIQDLFEELDSRKGVKNFKQLQLKKKNRKSKADKVET